MKGFRLLLAFDGMTIQQDLSCKLVVPKGTHKVAVSAERWHLSGVTRIQDGLGKDLIPALYRGGAAPLILAVNTEVFLYVEGAENLRVQIDEIRLDGVSSSTTQTDTPAGLRGRLSQPANL